MQLKIPYEISLMLGTIAIKSVFSNLAIYKLDVKKTKTTTIFEFRIILCHLELSLHFKTIV